MRPGESKDKRTPLGLRPTGSFRNWRRVSRMRRCVRAFSLGHRFNQWCSTPNASPSRFRKTTHSRDDVKTPGSAADEPSSLHDYASCISLRIAWEEPNLRTIYTDFSVWPIRTEIYNVGVGKP